MTDTLASRSVGELVRERLPRSAVFEHHGIDYCCAGQQSLAEACRTADVDLQQIVAELSVADAEQGAQDDRDWSIASMSELADHIVATHHAFMAQELPQLTRLIARVIEAHGASHPELIKVGQVFNALCEELRTHMMKEEQVLFPIVKQLEQAVAESVARPRFHCGSVNNPIAVMEDDHSHAGEALRHLRQLTADYTLPDDACDSFRALYARLEALERDLHIHIHKENNILFPRAAQAEAGLADN